MELLQWIFRHWAELAAALGLGGGGGLLAKKLSDQNRDAKISKIEKHMHSIDKDMATLKNKIETNTLFDKQFREQVEKDYNGIKSDMGEIKNRLSQIYDHLLREK